MTHSPMHSRPKHERYFYLLIQVRAASTELLRCIYWAYLCLLLIDLYMHTVPTQGFPSGALQPRDPLMILNTCAIALQHPKNKRSSITTCIFLQTKHRSIPPFSCRNPVFRTVRFAPSITRPKRGLADVSTLNLYCRSQILGGTQTKGNYTQR